MRVTSAGVPRPRRHRLLLWIVTLGLLLVVGAGVGAYALLRSDPGWYERVKLDPVRQAAGERDLLDRLATLHNAVGRSHVEVDRAGAAWPTFEMKLTEDEVNGVISRWYAAEGGFRAALGELTEPHVRFLSDRVEIAGRSPTMDSLISIELSVTRDASGAPTVRLGRPWAGRLPLSRSLIDADAAIARLQKDGGADGLPPPFVTALATLLRGDAVTPPIVPVSSSFNGAKLLPAKVERLTIDGGTLIATLRPFKPDASTTQAAAVR